MKYSEFNKKYADLELQYTDSDIYIYCDGVIVGKVSKEYRYRMSTHYDGFEQFPEGYAANLLMNMNMLSETPLSEREEEKRYQIRFPKVRRNGLPILLTKMFCSSGDYIIPDCPSETYIETHKEQFLFTEKEIRDIDERYLAFKVEVTP